MQIDQALPLFGGLSPAAFMRRHWQKKPLLVRQALPGVQPPVTRAQMFALAQQDDVESRLIVADGNDWKLRHGPLPRRALPAVNRPRWTLLVQGLDLHVQAAAEMLARFRFVPQARLDDLMISWASDGGGVGPHLDSYDVFLIQVHGRRRWRIGPVPEPQLQPGVPLKILTNFEPQEEHVLEPGDMLYLPPRWGHDGIAEGECMTCSVGFRVPHEGDLARELLQRLPELLDDEDAGRLYRDPRQPATAAPGRIPADLAAFAQQALARALRDPDALAAALGEVLSEPKPIVWFQQPEGEVDVSGGVALHRRSRMMYDGRFVFLNGESFRAGGRDARLMRRLADVSALTAREVAALSPEACELLSGWAAAGWVQPVAE